MGVLTGFGGGFGFSDRLLAVDRRLEVDLTERLLPVDRTEWLLATDRLLAIDRLLARDSRLPATESFFDGDFWTNRERGMSSFDTDRRLVRSAGTGCSPFTGELPVWEIPVGDSQFDSVGNTYSSSMVVSEPLSEPFADSAMAAKSLNDFFLF